jgi:hypothetical protein
LTQAVEVRGRRRIGLWAATASATSSSVANPSRWADQELEDATGSFGLKPDQDVDQHEAAGKPRMLSGGDQRGHAAE